MWASERLRPALAAVLAFDLELERVAASPGEPMMAELRLAWWRERLSEVAQGALPPPQPLLRALAHHARPAGIDLVALLGIEDALLPILADGPVDAGAVAEARGRALAQALAPVLGPAGSLAAAAARVAFARFARRPWGRAGERVAAALARWRDGPARPFETASPHGLPRVLRALDAPARQDLLLIRQGRPLPPPATAGRQARMAWAALGLPSGRGRA